MKFKAASLLTWACLVATSAIAGEEGQTRIEIEVDDDVTGQRSFFFDSLEAGFDLDSMAVGETRTVTDKVGNIADIRRTDDGFEFDLNGETIELDAWHSNGSRSEHDVDIHVDRSSADSAAVKKVKMIRTENPDGVTVISSGEIDAATRERIHKALASGGQEGDVIFIDGSELDVRGDSKVHRKHEVRIIEKEVDVTN